MPGEPGVTNKPSSPPPDDFYTTSGSMVVREARPDAGMASEQLQEALPSEGLGEPLGALSTGSGASSLANQDVEAPSSDGDKNPSGAQAIPADTDPGAASSDTADSVEPASTSKGRATLLVGVILLVIVVCFTVFLPNPNRYQWLVFGMLAALGGACIATVLSGFLEVESKQIKAGGALAVFTVVFFVFYSEIPERPGMSAPLNSGQRVVDGLLNIEMPVLPAKLGNETESATGNAGELDENETTGGEEEDTDSPEYATGGPVSSDFPGDTDALFAKIDGGR